MVRHSANKKRDPQPLEKPDISVDLAILLDRAINRGGLKTIDELEQFLSGGKSVVDLDETALLDTYRDRVNGLSGTKEDPIAFLARLSELLYKRSDDLEHLLDALYLRKELLRFYDKEEAHNFYRDQIGYSPVAEIENREIPRAPVVAALLEHGELALEAVRTSHSHFSLFPQKCECFVRQVIDTLSYLHSHKEHSVVLAKTERVAQTDEEGTEPKKGPKKLKPTPISIAELRTDLAVVMRDQLHQFRSHLLDSTYWSSTMCGSTPLWGVRFVSGYIERGLNFLENNWAWDGDRHLQIKRDFERAEAELEKVYDEKSWLEAKVEPNRFSADAAKYEEAALKEVLPLDGENFADWSKRMHVLQQIWLMEYEDTRASQVLHARGLDVRYLSYPNPRTINGQY